jgi:hypothetical protein
VFSRLRCIVLVEQVFLIVLQSFPAMDKEMAEATARDGHIFVGQRYRQQRQ